MAGTYVDIINKRKKDWNCSSLMDGALSKKGKKLPFSSPLLNYSTYGGIPRNQITEFFGDPGGGKAQPLYSKVLTPTGYKLMKDIQCGDVIFDGTGKLCHVDGVYPQGSRQVYEIRTSMNNYVRVADNHLNSVWMWDEDGNRVDYVWTTEKLIEEFDSNSNDYIYVDTPLVDYNVDSDCFVDPYVAGYLLAYGSVNENSISLSLNSSADVHKLNKLLFPLEFEFKDTHWELHKPDLVSYVYDNLVTYLLDPHISECYKFNTLEVRSRFIEGATDASRVTTSTGNPVVIILDYIKSEEFASIARSTGIIDDQSTFVVTNNNNASIAYEHELYLKDTTDGSLLSGVYRRIVNIEYVGEEECQCIHVDSEEHTYISDDFIPTHNTTTAIDICKKAYEIFQHEYEEQLYDLREKSGNGNKQAKLDLDELETRGPKKILYVDLEHSFDADWSHKLGIEPGTIDIMQPPDVVAEELLQTIQEIIETGEVGLIVLDSIPSLTTRQELDKKYGERTVASLAGLLTVFFRKTVPLLSRYECTMLIINQVRDNMDNPYVVNTPGGKALKFYCSLRMLFRIGTPVDFLGNELPSSAENPAGYIVTAKIVKQKSAPWDRRNGSYYLMAQSGIRTDMDFAKLAVTKYGIIRKAGAWFTMCDPFTGEVLEDEDSKPIKVNGMVKVFDYLQTHPEYYQKVQDFILADIAGEDIETSIEADIEGTDDD